MLPIWETLTRPHIQAQVHPRSPFPTLSPSHPPPPGCWQTLTVPGGAHQLVQHRAHLGLRRHGGGGVAGRQAGVGRRLGPFGRGGPGEGVGGGETLSRLQSPPQGVRKESRRGCRELGLCSSRRRVRGRQEPSEATRVPSLRRVPETEAIPTKQALASNTATRQKPSAPP